MFMRVCVTCLMCHVLCEMFNVCVCVCVCVVSTLKAPDLPGIYSMVHVPSNHSSVFPPKVQTIVAKY